EVQWQSLANAAFAGDLLREFTPFDFQTRAEELFRRLEQFRVLCAVREGPQGVKAVNAAVEQSLKRKLGLRHEDEWYPGKPILITQNDYSLNLFNGDVGLVLPDPENSDELRAHFMSQDGGPRRLRPFRLPEHETAYAMTVHKSQGSEFARVLLLLPAKDTPLLTRELIYTGITRAAEAVQICGDEAVFKAAVARRIRRTSGLRDALWG
ncbi:MAG: exodeoxyribonuclease V subunit alpha, partial [Calditrichaeota bacterium]